MFATIYMAWMWQIFAECGEWQWLWITCEFSLYRQVVFYYTYRTAWYILLLFLMRTLIFHLHKVSVSSHLLWVSGCLWWCHYGINNTMTRMFWFRKFFSPAKTIWHHQLMLRKCMRTFLKPSVLQQHIVQRILCAIGCRMWRNIWITNDNGNVFWQLSVSPVVIISSYVFSWFGCLRFRTSMLWYPTNCTYCMAWYMQLLTHRTNIHCHD